MEPESSNSIAEEVVYYNEAVVEVVGEAEETLKTEEEEERRLKRVYEENVDKVITELERRNYFLGYDQAQSRDQFLLHKKVLKRYKVELVPYRESWSVDLFAVGHNTVKTEILDMYDIVRSLEDQGREVGKGPVLYFCGWWSTFLSVVTEFLDMEDQVIYPWIENKADLGGTRLSKSNRTSTRRQLRDLMLKAVAQESNLDYIPPSEVVLKMLEVLNELDVVLLTYINHVKAKIPQLVEEKFTEDEYRCDLLPAISSHLHSTEDWNKVAPITIRWMREDQAAFWQSEFLTRRDKRKFSNWRRLVERTHWELRDCVVERRTPKTREARKVLEGS
ncbi:hypothetical protein NDN08_001239 [Rhodosorus marinus]|uniref:Uncharacterized protein n=1 Tax=Rhodosorus marinus TaxID=101924 RepID=A0AAV8UW10_9RHOD|nr:hypothetical protein NDN08_001239 [Rhodosorus marinus]